MVGEDKGLDAGLVGGTRVTEMVNYWYKYWKVKSQDGRLIS